MDDITKAKRRIKRFVLTGIAQARVEQITQKHFVYHTKHHSVTLHFKVDKLGRCQLLPSQPNKTGV